MAPRFLGKTSIEGLTLLEIDGHPVLDDYARLRDFLQARAPAAAGLLAEPIGNWRTRGTPVVSWYAEATNDPETFTALSGDRRRQVETQLRNAMAALAPLFGDPVAGAALRRALVLSGPEGIKAVDGWVVLTDWGMVPAATEIPADPFALSPLAAYLAPASAATVAQPAAAPRPPPIPPPASPLPAPAAAAPAVRRVWNWWLVPAGIAVAALFLILGLWLGTRQIAAQLAQQPTTVALFDEPAARAILEQQQAQNAALEHELEERRRTLGGDVCPVDPAQMPRPGADHAAVVPPAATPTPPGGQPFHGNLAELLTQSVVMVIAQGQDGTKTGSGFFIAPDLVVTNRHVVEDALPGKLAIAGGKLTGAARGEIVAETQTSEIGQLDIALLRVAPVPGVQPLAMSTAASALDPVIAAGFPGLTMHGDDASSRLLEGDLSAVPTIILTDGRISAIQTAPGGLKIMPHTAAVSGGNSGGPLVDACGRVVGVNTFITADQEQVAHTNYAQKSDAVIAFLQANGAAFTAITDPCAPPSTPSASQASAPPASASPPPATPASVPQPAQPPR